MTHLTPLADTSNFDEQLKRRCLPLLSAGSSNSELWDSAVRTAGVILEERLRDVGSISDPNRTGSALVNDVFNERGTLASKFTVPSERQGYRDLYAGIVGAFRNPSAHRLIDPSPEVGQDGTIEPLKGLHFYRTSYPSECIHSVSIPSFCVIAQGSKEVLLGSDRYQYDPMHYLLGTVELPIASRILEATQERPYLGFRLDLDPAFVGSVMVEAGYPSAQRGVSVKAIDCQSPRY